MIKLYCNIFSFNNISETKFAHVEIENHFEAQQFYAHKQGDQSDLT
jgi:hypothetical protein